MPSSGQHAIASQSPDLRAADAMDTMPMRFQLARTHCPPKSHVRSTCQNPPRLLRPSLAPAVNAYLLVHQTTPISQTSEYTASTTPTCQTLAARPEAAPSRNSAVQWALFGFARSQLRPAHSSIALLRPDY